MNAKLGRTQTIGLGLIAASVVAAAAILARAMGFSPLFGFLSGGATALCGASAAMAEQAGL